MRTVEDQLIHSSGVVEQKNITVMEEERPSEEESIRPVYGPYAPVSLTEEELATQAVREMVLEMERRAASDTDPSRVGIETRAPASRLETVPIGEESIRSVYGPYTPVEAELIQPMEEEAAPCVRTGEGHSTVTPGNRAREPDPGWLDSFPAQYPHVPKFVEVALQTFPLSPQQAPKFKKLRSALRFSSALHGLK